MYSCCRAVALTEQGWLTSWIFWLRSKMAWASFSFSVSSSYTAVAPMSSGPTGFWKAGRTCDNSEEKTCTRQRAPWLPGGLVTEQVLDVAGFTFHQFLPSLSTCQGKSPMGWIQPSACRKHLSLLYSFTLSLGLAGSWTQVSHVQHFNHETIPPTRRMLLSELLTQLWVAYIQF